MTKILLIEDEAISRELASTVLQDQGYEVIEAIDGSTVQRLILDEQPDIIITDILMPETDGIEVITSIRKKYPDLPIIAVSGGGSVGASNYLTMAKGLGANEVIQKPIEWDTFLVLIENLTT